jgi:twitching motility protein PilT
VIEKSMQTTGKRNMRLGELLVERGLISINQLKDSLKKQAQEGGHLGSILVEMGFITTDDLLTFLSRQFGTPSADLFKTYISPGVIELMPLEKIKALKVMPIGVDGNSVTLAMVNPHDLISIRDIEFSLGKKVKPVVVPSSQMEVAIQNLSLHTKSLLTAGVNRAVRRPEAKGAFSLAVLLKELAASPSADMLLTAGTAPCLKLGNKIWRTSAGTVTADDCEKLAKELASEKDWEKFMLKHDCDFAVTYPDIGRFRTSLYIQRNSVSITVRHIPDILPSPEELRLPGWLKERVLERSGIIFVCGPSGHGKTTTLAAAVDIINSSRDCNIVTLEDPIEYLHKHGKSNVNQRGVGPDVESFCSGIKHASRQDADVIVVDEIADPDSFAAALEAADTGHLVITALRARTAAPAIEKVINSFPMHLQGVIRSQIADNLLFVLSQRLVPVKEGKGRILAWGKIMNSPAVRDLIGKGKTDQINSRMMDGSGEYGSLESSLADLYLSGMINFEEGLIFAQDVQLYKDLTKGP